MSLTEQSFYATVGQENLADYLEIFGVNRGKAVSLETIVEATQPWVKGDHALPSDRVGQISEDAKTKLGELHKKFGINHEMPLEQGKYDNVLVLGGLHRGNENRLSFLRIALEVGGIVVGRVVLLGGERPVYESVERAGIEETAKGLLDSGREVDEAGVREIATGHRAVKNETEMLELALYSKFSGVKFRANLPYGKLFELATGTEVFVTHTDAVARPNGGNRHTTEACIRDFVNNFEDRIKDGSRIPLIATNPHTVRTARVAQRVIGTSDLSDVSIIPAGPAPYGSYSIELFRGEVARLLYEDLQDTLGSRNRP